MSKIDLERARELEEEYDPEVSFRKIVPPASYVVAGLLFFLSAFHYYTSGFGVLVEHWHKGIHLALVLGLIFIVFPLTKSATTTAMPSAWWRPGGVPLYDWALFALTVVCAIYIPASYATIAFRIGAPNTLDVVLGTFMILIVLETTRRSMGLALPIIVTAFIGYALWGPVMPGPLVHPGTTWPALVDHLYMTTEGIFGLPAMVVATYVFHFVLFGVVATRMGLGQLFIDLAQCAAGRYSGGPAKVSVLSSAMFGTISGSSIANTVTTGALTIPAMKRIGYKPHFAAAVEAASSTGGQITPPIMGAAAFLMVEFLEIPYRHIVLAAIIPATMHFLGVLAMVHFEAKRLGLRGLTEAEMPKFADVLRTGWPTLIPLLVLIGYIFYGYSPYKAAFAGITACLIVGFLNPYKRLTIPDVIDAFQLGAKYALAVGAAAAAVGMIVGVITLSGVAFKISFIVTTFAGDLAAALIPFVPFGILTQLDLTLFLTLLFVAIACIFMGAGLPTTATYIVLVAITAPALKLLGVPELPAHFFVLFYGVLADITPPVAVAAYAAAGIAGCNPFQAGNTAFRLGLAKALVPFVFVYAPSMLLVVPGRFSWSELILSTSTCALGIVLLAGAITGYMRTAMPNAIRAIGVVAALLLIFPSNTMSAIGLALSVIVGLQQFTSKAAVKPVQEAAD